MNSTHNTDSDAVLRQQPDVCESEFREEPAMKTKEVELFDIDSIRERLQCELRTGSMSGTSSSEFDLNELF